MQFCRPSYPPCKDQARYVGVSMITIYKIHLSSSISTLYIIVNKKSRINTTQLCHNLQPTEFQSAQLPFVYHLHLSRFLKKSAYFNYLLHQKELSFLCFPCIYVYWYVCYINVLWIFHMISYVLSFTYFGSTMVKESGSVTKQPQ